MITITRESIKEYGDSTISIYGVGRVAELLYKALISLKCENIVKQFVVTHKKDELFYGKKIVSLSDYNTQENGELWVAVHEANWIEIREQLSKRGIEGRWVYPDAYRLWLGFPREESAIIPVKTIWRSCQYKYLVALRLLCVKQYYGEENHGYDLYLQDCNIGTDEQTVRKRLDGYLRLIKSWDENGYDKRCAINIRDNYTLIDGHHRLALALYHGLDEMTCNIYDANQILDLEHERSHDSKRELLARGVDALDIEKLDRLVDAIDMQFSK